MTHEELIDLVRKVKTGDYDTDEEANALGAQLEQELPGASDILFWDKDGDSYSPEEVITKARQAHRVFAGEGGELRITNPGRSNESDD